MKKIITKISAAAIALAALPSAAYAGEEPSNEGKKIKIMCIGDSITDGYVPEYTGSYRKFIYRELTEKGYEIDMVGSKGEDYQPVYTDEKTGESFEYDNGNTGYSGYAITAYPGRNGILETLEQTDCLAQTKPDIVTLQIGTNDIIDFHDIDTSGERLGMLIEYILRNIPETSALYVTTIPDLDPNREEVRDWFGNYRHSADWQTWYSDEEAELAINAALKKYNGIVEASVERLRAEHGNLWYADVNSAIKDVKTQLFDGVHPNDEGYRAMGSYWAEILDEYLQGNVPQVTQPVTTTEPTTTAGEEISETIKVADLVAFSRFLLGDKRTETDKERQKLYDLDKDGILDSYDLVLMRKKLTEESRI